MKKLTFKNYILLLVLSFFIISLGSCTKFKEEKALVRNSIETIDKNTKIDLKVTFNEFQPFYEFTVEDSMQISLDYFIKKSLLANATFDNYERLVDSIVGPLNEEYTRQNNDLQKNKREFDKTYEEQMNTLNGLELMFGESAHREKRQLNRLKDAFYIEYYKELNKNSVILERINLLESLKTKLSNEYDFLSGKNTSDVLYTVYKVDYSWFSPTLQTTKSKITFFKIYEGTDEVREDEGFIIPEYREDYFKKEGLENDSLNTEGSLK